MPSLRAIFSADSTPFSKELREAEKLAQRAGRTIEQSLNAGGGSGGHGGKSGAIREFVIMTRELARGDLTRLPGSLSIFLQRIGLLNGLFKDSASASRVVAEAYSQAAISASAGALAATRKAAATSAAFQAEAESTEATLAAALADEQAAVAARANAAALVQKAEAASAAASSEASAAAATGAAAVSTFGVVAGIVLAIGAGIFAAYTLSKALVDRLSGLKTPDFHPEYIAKHLQAANQAAEGWKEINKEVEKAIENYHSVAKAAERVADATKTHFEHERKMAELAKERDMAGAHSPAQKAQVESDYAQKQLDISKRERDEEIRNKNEEMFNLQREGNKKKAEADAIKAPSKEHDQNLLAQAKQQKDEAEKFLDGLQKDRTEGPSFDDRGVAIYNAVALTGVSGKDLEDARNKSEIEARRRIQAYKGTVDTVADNEEKRKKKEDLTKQAGASLSEAGKIGESLPDMRKKAADANKNQAEEAAAKQAVDDAKRSGERATVLHGSVNALQQIGAYTSPAEVTQLDVGRKSLGKLEHIHQTLKNIEKRGGPKLGGVNHG